MGVSTGLAASLLLALPLVLLGQQTQSPVPNPQSDRESLLILNERIQNLQVTAEKLDSTVDNLSTRTVRMEAIALGIGAVLSTAVVVLIAVIQGLRKDAALLRASLEKQAESVQENSLNMARLSGIMEGRSANAAGTGGASS